MSDIKAHLETIRNIDSTGYDRGRKRAQALEHVAGAVADAMLEGRTVPVYCGVEGFFTTEGFDQAVAAQLVVRHETLIEQRAKLADRLEEKGVVYGVEAARILRAMNPSTCSEVINKHGENVEVARARLAHARAELAALNLAERSGLVDPSLEWHQARLAKARADLAELKVAELKATKPTQQVADLVRDAIAELGSNPGTEEITHMEPIDGCWVEVKVYRMEKDEDTGPEYDTIDQSEIRGGDYVEYHNADSVRRWMVLMRGTPTHAPHYVQVQLIDDHISPVETVQLPLPGDPFILRRRS